MSPKKRKGLDKLPNEICLELRRIIALKVYDCVFQRCNEREGSKTTHAWVVLNSSTRRWKIKIIVLYPRVKGKRWRVREPFVEYFCKTPDTIRFQFEITIINFLETLTCENFWVNWMTISSTSTHTISNLWNWTGKYKIWNTEDYRG